MSTTEKAFEVSLLFTDFEHQALVTNVPNDYKELVSSQSSLNGLAQNATPFTEVRKSLNGFSAFLMMKWKFEKPVVVLPQLFNMIQKLKLKNSAPVFSKWLEMKNNILILHFDFRCNASYSEAIIEA